MSSLAPLSLFISSKMKELTEERHAIQAALKEVLMYGWLWETDAGARPEPIQSTYLTEVANCDIYLGLFWQGYGPYTIQEYEHARTLNKPCLIYEKHVDREQRDPRLTAFLDGLQQVTSPKGLTVRRFQEVRELTTCIQEDIMRLLTTIFRESRLQPQQLWNIPYPRNPFFTGREELLSQLHNQLQTGQAAALSQPQAISGLGGIGKTQLALEYAYHHRQDYQAVLWAQADTRENLISSYLTIATLLNLPEKSEQESARVIAAVKNWLQHNTRWLLILDNADDLALARDFLPPSPGGQVLLTTRAQATGRFARRLEVNILSTELAALFLLRRAGLLPIGATLEQASEHDRSVARAICEEVGGLPLALDQAGAYIEETGCSLAEYQRLYQHRRADLLAERRGQLVDDHPLPVATTWSLSFAQVEQKNLAAADLLRLCAFLAPDAIPEEMITQGAEHLGPQLAPVGADPYLLNQSIEALRAYSLLRREANSGTVPLLSMHRLVQAVILDQMDSQSRHQ